MHSLNLNHSTTQGSKHESLVPTCLGHFSRCLKMKTLSGHDPSQTSRRLLRCMGDQRCIEKRMQTCWLLVLDILLSTCCMNVPDFGSHSGMLMSCLRSMNIISIVVNNLLIFTCCLQNQYCLRCAFYVFILYCIMLLIILVVFFRRY